MKKTDLIKKLSLTEEDFMDIQEAVKEAEQKTSGEIALAIASESSSYAFWELLASAATTMFFLLCLVPLASQINTWLSTVFWGENTWYLLAFYIIAGTLMMILFYLLYNIPAIDTLVIPQGAKNAAVSRRAMRYFAESGVYLTESHSGILVFISFFEKQVRIVADSGISKKISQDVWNIIADEVSESMGKGNVKEAFISAVSKCSLLLSENFPIQADDKNELPDGLVILEDEKWA